MTARFFALAGIPVILIGTFLGCESSAGPEDRAPDKNLGRIRWMESIDSVEPGLSEPEVRDLLGTPEAVGRGDWAGHDYEYGIASTSVIPPEMSVTFANEYDNRVLWIVVNAPYTGLTREGIGIGTDKRVLRAFYGEPDAQEMWVSGVSFPTGVLGDVYLGDSVAMVVSYRNSQIREIRFTRTSILSPTSDAESQVPPPESVSVMRLAG